MPRPATGTNPKLEARVPQTTIDQIDALGGNRSETVRELLDEALSARDARKAATTHRRPGDPYAFLTEDQLLTADRLIEAFDIAEVGALKGIDYSKPRVDGGGGAAAHGIHRERMRGLGTIRKARLKLGDQAFGMLCDFLLAGIPGHEGIIRDALDRIAHLFGGAREQDTVDSRRLRRVIIVPNDTATPRPKAPVRFVGFGRGERKVS